MVPGKKINVLSDEDRRELLELTRAAEAARQAANDAAARRRSRILEHMARGATYREIAEVLGISRGSVQNIISRHR